MSALVKKEVRLLLPGFLGCAALSLGNFFYQGDGGGVPWSTMNFVVYFITVLLCPAIAVFMALSSFGAEISGGTFSMLLAQPLSRPRIWWTKTGLLAGALSLGGLFWFITLFLRVILLHQTGDLRNWPYWVHIFFSEGVFLLVIFSGALWTVLLLRQVAAAFWFTLLIPGAIFMAVELILDTKFRVLHMAPFVDTALIAYSIAGFIFARWLFLRAQDIAWTGGDIALPQMSRFQGRSSASPRQLWRPRLALFWKEAQLHQAQMIFAGALVALHLAALAARKFGHFENNSITKFALDLFWGLWLAMPMLVGAASVAEERKLGTLASQLTLPVKRGRQFAIKFLVVVLLSAFFGAVMPCLLEGGRNLPNLHFAYFNWVSFPPWLKTLNHLLPFLVLLAGAIGIGMVSFFASSLAGSTLQALSPAVLGIVAFVLLGIAAHQEYAFHDHLLWAGPLVYVIGIPVFIGALIRQSFKNCQLLRITWKNWLRNAGNLFLILVCVVVGTGAIYHRAWEKLTPFEPEHGAAQLSLAHPPTLTTRGNKFSIRLPDGRVWLSAYAGDFSSLNPVSFLLANIKMGNWVKPGFMPGSNWLTVAFEGYYGQIAGIKTDGTLWIGSLRPEPPSRLMMLHDFEPYGAETNWSSLATSGAGMLLVKTDGTLWRLGPFQWNNKTNWPGLQTFTAKRIGTESNWDAVFTADYHTFLREKNGRVWTTSAENDETREKLQVAPEFQVFRAPGYEKHQWRSTLKSYNNGYGLGVAEDGSFRIMAEMRPQYLNGVNGWVTVDQQIGQETNWLALAGSFGGKIVTLKNDGTLWVWNFSNEYWHPWNPHWHENEMLTAKPEPLSTHSDWIAISTGEGGIYSLAADGGLWYWPLEELPNYEWQQWQHSSNDRTALFITPLLDISHKPQLLDTIFSLNGHAANH